jgi:hypothetical protein
MSDGPVAPEDPRKESSLDHYKPKFDRYMDYIIQALSGDEDWERHSDAFLRSLGKDPDELERQAAENDAEILDYVAKQKQRHEAE